VERLSPSETARVCASLGFRYLQAKVLGDATTAARISADLVGATCDPKWLEKLDEYLKFFGPDGARREIPYIRAKAVGPQTIGVPAGARIGLIGDWGTGAEPARRILVELKNRKVDAVIHLGDIYYSGTPDECQANFTAIFDEVFGKVGKRVPVYTLSENHDMYCGGAGYYGLIKKLNAAPYRQPASFFCLRAADSSWQFLAMDTGLHDYSPHTVDDAVPWLESDEEEWHRKRIEEFHGKSIRVDVIYRLRQNETSSRRPYRSCRPRGQVSWRYQRIDEGLPLFSLGGDQPNGGDVRRTIAAALPVLFIWRAWASIPAALR
jgi:hypothetical protein